MADVVAVMVDSVVTSDGATVDCVDIMEDEGPVVMLVGDVLVDATPELDCADKDSF